MQDKKTYLAFFCASRRNQIKIEKHLGCRIINKGNVLKNLDRHAA